MTEAQELAKTGLAYLESMAENAKFLEGKQYEFNRLKELLVSHLPREFYWIQPVLVSDDKSTWVQARFWQLSESPDGGYDVLTIEHGICHWRHCKPDPDGERAEYERLKSRLGIESIDWIEHDGIPNCPCPQAKVVLLLRRNKHYSLTLNPTLINWGHGDQTEPENAGDIITYAVLE